MGIVRSVGPLFKAATGKDPEPTPAPMDTTYGQALASKLPQAGTYADFAKSQGLYSGVPVTTQGLSSEGKYGGYYTASDLETAIVGEAMGRNQQALDYAQTMRDLAAKRAGDIRRTYASQLGALQRGADLTPKDLFGGYFRDPGETLKAQQLEEYQTQKLGEVGQTMETASMIEETPVSQYARAIATQRYGMNPALAAGMFGTEFDLEQQQNLRDQQFLDVYGMSEADYRAAQEREYQQGERAYRTQERLVQQAIDTRDLDLLKEPALQGASAAVRDLYYTDTLSQQLGTNAKGVISASGLTPQQAYAAASRPITIQQTGETVSFGNELDQISGLLQEGDFDTAINRVSRLVYTDAEPIGRLLSSYVVNLARIAGKPLKEYADLSTLYEIGLQNPDFG